jgi:diadenosine tetraphosphate (Ap4A) HIT family hydrolase
MNTTTCPLCADPGGTLVFKGEKFRVIRADEPGFPAFYRVVWTDHVAEFSDLGVDDRHLCLAAVVAVELALREQVQPTKINLAALGNMVPHLHWHVIARFDWDSHFPAPVWAAAVRPQNTEALAGVAARLAQADLAIKSALAALCRGV